MTIQSLSMFLCFKMTALPVYFIHLKMSTLTSASLQCGDCNPTQPLQGCGYPDYVDNRLGGFEPEQNKEEKLKPDCALIGQDGNIFNLLGIASRTLKQNGMAYEAKEMCSRVTSFGSYCEALNIIGEYVNITDGSEQSDDIDEDYGEGQVMKL